MELIGVKENNGWLQSRWKLTYAVDFDRFLWALSSMYTSYRNPEILTDNNLLKIDSEEDIFEIEECGSLTIRGSSTILKHPIMITFYNQLRDVDVYVPLDAEEFNEADYEKFNRSLCQYMDSVEIMMYSKHV